MTTAGRQLGVECRSVHARISVRRSWRADRPFSAGPGTRLRAWRPERDPGPRCRGGPGVSGVTPAVRPRGLEGPRAAPAPRPCPREGRAPRAQRAGGLGGWTDSDCVFCAGGAESVCARGPPTRRRGVFHFLVALRASAAWHRACSSRPAAGVARVSMSIVSHYSYRRGGRPARAERAGGVAGSGPGRGRPSRRGGGARSAAPPPLPPPPPLGLPLRPLTSDAALPAPPHSGAGRHTTPRGLRRGSRPPPPLPVATPPPTRGPSPLRPRRGPLPRAPSPPAPRPGAVPTPHPTHTTPTPPPLRGHRRAGQIRFRPEGRNLPTLRLTPPPRRIQVSTVPVGNDWSSCGPQGLARCRRWVS